jgi:hypothetical protein
MPDIPSTPQTSTIADTAAGAVGGTVGTVQGTAAAAAAPVPAPQPAKAAAAVADAVTAAPTPTSTASQVADTAGAAVANAAAPAAVTQAAEPAVPAVGATTGGAGSSVTRVTDTVTSAAGQTAAPVRPITDSVAAASSGATRAAESVATGVGVPGGPGGPGAADAISAATTQAHQALAPASGGRSLVDTASQAMQGPGAGLAGALAPGAGPGGVATALAPGADPVGLAAPPAPDPTTTSLLGHAAPASAPAPGSGAAHGAATDTLAQVATDPRLLAVTGVTALAGTAYVAARAAGCVAGGDSSVILNNVRLIPCLARTSMTASGTALAGLGSGVREAAGSVTRTTRAELHVLGEHVSGTADKARQDLSEHVVEPFRDGLARATDGRGMSGANGSDLFFLGIGMVVGLLYAAILSLWLFLVRPRWSTRA